jgi:uncharacterized protein YceK
MRWLLIALLAVALLSGCAYYQKQVAPQNFYTAPQMEAKGLKISNHVVKSRYGFRLLTIPISVPEPNEMIESAIRETGGKGITNLDVEFSEFNIFLFGIPKMRVTGDVVK